MGYMVKWTHPENGPGESFMHTVTALRSTLESLGVPVTEDPDGQGLVVVNGQPVYWTRVPSIWVAMAGAIAQFEAFGAEKGDDAFSNGQAAAFKQCAERFRGIFGQIIQGT
jgi:hypothetical protein